MARARTRCRADWAGAAKPWSIQPWSSRSPATEGRRRSSGSRHQAASALCTLAPTLLWAHGAPLGSGGRAREDIRYRRAQSSQVVSRVGVQEYSRCGIPPKLSCSAVLVTVSPGLWPCWAVGWQVISQYRHFGDDAATRWPGRARLGRASLVLFGPGTGGAAPPC